MNNRELEKSMGVKIDEPMSMLIEAIDRLTFELRVMNVIKVGPINYKYWEDQTKLLEGK
ncbi:MAG: hypothetical protein M0R80_13305 [Proteobacteria bacterium]|jgi:hypothetical protein|nr:hypothetical protein [Pseudomonadota bacterium]